MSTWLATVVISAHCCSITWDRL